jgi:hypothetical protein
LGFSFDQITSEVEENWGDPHFDVITGPGDVLYVPRGVYHWATSLEDYSMHLTTQAGVWNQYDHCGDWCISHVWGSVLGNSYENMRTQLMELTGQVRTSPTSQIKIARLFVVLETIHCGSGKTLLLRDLQVTPCSPVRPKRSLPELISQVHGQTHCGFWIGPTQSSASR